MASFTCLAVGWLWDDGAMKLSSVAWACFHSGGSVPRERVEACKLSWGLGVGGTLLFLWSSIVQSKAGSDPRIEEIDFLDGGAAKFYYKG